MSSPCTLYALPSYFPGPFALLPLHRRANVDDGAALQPIFRTLADFSSELRILFPVHPRTRQQLREFGLDRLGDNRVQLLDPLPYIEFLGLQEAASLVITDSGGIQEEPTFLGSSA